jgi:hypothetical protein
MIIKQKRINHTQWEVWEAAKRNAMHVEAQAMDEALRLYVEKYGLQWPETQPHGGARKGAGRKAHPTPGSDGDE